MYVAASSLPIYNDHAPVAEYVQIREAHVYSSGCSFSNSLKNSISFSILVRFSSCFSFSKSSDSFFKIFEGFNLALNILIRLSFFSSS